MSTEVHTSSSIPWWLLLNYPDSKEFTFFFLLLVLLDFLLCFQIDVKVSEEIRGVTVIFKGGSLPEQREQKRKSAEWLTLCRVLSGLRAWQEMYHYGWLMQNSLTEHVGTLRS